MSWSLSSHNMEINRNTKRLKTDLPLDSGQEPDPKVASSFEDATTADATLVVGSLRLPVHRNLLALHSDYFKSLFSETWDAEKRTSFEIKDVDPIGFRLLLQFVYEKRLDLKNLSNDELTSLFTISLRFLFLGLSKKLMDVMIKALAKGTESALRVFPGMALDWLSLAFKHELLELRVRVKSYLELNAAELLEDLAFSSTPFHVMEEILSSDSFYAKEVVIFEFINKWIKVQIKDGQEVDVKAAYSLVRFPLICDHDLKDKVLPAIKGLGVDLTQNLTKYRGCFKWETNRLLLSLPSTLIHEEINYFGPTLTSFGYVHDIKSSPRCLFLEFDKPYALNNFNLLTRGRNRVNTRLKLTFRIKEGDKLTGEMTCNPINFDDRFWMFVCNQTEIMASRLEIHNLEGDMVKFEIISMSTPVAFKSLPLRTLDNVFHVKIIDEERKQYLAGANAPHKGQEIDHLTHPIPSREGITLFYVIDYRLVGMVVYLRDENVYDFDVSLSSDGETFHWISSFSKVKQRVEFSFSERIVSAIRFIGKKAYESETGTDSDLFEVANVIILLS